MKINHLLLLTSLTIWCRRLRRRSRITTSRMCRRRRTGANLWPAAKPTAAAAVAAWWKNFSDPELDSLISRAAQSNLDLKIAQARVREARAEYGIAVGNLLPTVDASGSYARQRESQHQPLVGPGDRLPPGIPFENNFYQSGFDASWEIDVFGGKRRAVESAKAQVAAAEFGERDALVTLLGEVARNYVEARGYQRQLEIARENIRAQEQSLALTQNRFTNGLANNLDVQQAAPCWPPRARRAHAGNGDPGFDSPARCFAGPAA